VRACGAVVRIVFISIRYSGCTGVQCSGGQGALRQQFRSAVLRAGCITHDAAMAAVATRRVAACVRANASTETNLCRNAEASALPYGEEYAHLGVVNLQCTVPTEKLDFVYCGANHASHSNHQINRLRMRNVPVQAVTTECEPARGHAATSH
jgi:hypothetical protein